MPESHSNRPDEEFFAVARTIKTAEGRRKYLDQVCADDPETRREIEELLAIYDREPSFMESPPPELMVTADSKDGSRSAETIQNVHEAPGTMIGPYKILELIGEGGMGNVYMAEQTEPVRRKVALKVIKPGMDTGHVIARFEAERQALALMDHPNIAKMLDAGSTPSGRPYFVMDLVRGVPITEYCDQARLSTRDRLELFVTVCRAVQHAHHKGIIHRDIKPSNVMVTRIGETAVPKVIDFGVAKATNQRLTERTINTQFTTMIGSPLYMSPEQAEMSKKDVDTRTDVYSLGVLMYELLTGNTPFDKEQLSSAGYGEIRRIIRDQEPPKPSDLISTLHGERLTTVAEQRHVDARRLRQSLRGELDWIVIKALEKDRTRRYESASDLAADVERFLHHEPVHAQPPTLARYLTMWTMRHRPLVASVAVALFLTTIGLSISNYFVSRARTRAENVSQELRVALDDKDAALAERHAAQQREAETVRRFYPLNVTLADDLINARDYGLAHSLLNQYRRGEPLAGRRDFEWSYLWGLVNNSGARVLRGHTETVWSLSFSPDGNLLATSSGDGTFRIWDTATGELVRENQEHDSDVNCVAFSPDGRHLATASDDHTVVLWDAKTGERDQTLLGHADMVSCVRFTPDGRRLVSGSVDGEVRIWDRASGTVLNTVQAHNDRICAIAISSDGRRIATGSRGQDKTAKLWDWEMLRQPAIMELLAGVQALTFDPKTDDLLSCLRNGSVTRRDGKTGRHIDTFHVHVANGLLGMGCSPDGRRLAFAGFRAPLLVLDKTGTIKSTYSVGSDLPTLCVKFSADGQYLAAGHHHDVLLWRLEQPPSHRTLATYPFDVNVVTVSPDGQTVVAGDENGVLRQLQVATGKEIGQVKAYDGVVTCACYSPDGTLLATGSTDDAISIRRDLEDDNVLNFSGGGSVRDLGFSLDGQFLAAVHEHGIRVWDTQSWGVARDFSIGLRFSQNSHIAFSFEDGIIFSDQRTGYVWLDNKDNPRIHSYGGLTAMDVNGDGSALTYASANGEVYVWKLHGRSIEEASHPAEEASHRLQSQTDADRVIRSLAFSPSGRTVAGLESSGAVNLWDTDTDSGTLMLRLTELTDLRDVARFEKWSLAFAGDGSALIAGGTYVTDEAAGEQRKGFVFAWHGHDGDVASPSPTNVERRKLTW